MVTQRNQLIMVCISGKKAQYGSFEELEEVLRPYRDAMSKPPEEPLAPIWVDIQYPYLNTMQMLMRYFAIHSLTVEDCMLESEKAQQKVELFESYRFLSFAEHHVVPFTNIWNSIDVHLILPLSTPVLIAVHHGPVGYVCGILNRIQALTSLHAPLRGRSVQVRSPGKCIFPSSEWLMYAIVDNIVDQFFDLVYECAVEVSRLDELIYVLPAREQTDFLRRIGAVRGRISVLKMQLVRKHEILKTLLMDPTDQKVWNLATVKAYMRDVLDHVVAMLVDLEQDKETLGSIATSFMARVAIEMALHDREQNAIMKKFSAMATIVMPLTFIGGLWGMNVPVPFQGSIGTGAFGGILGLLLLAAAITFALFWFIDWL